MVSAMVPGVRAGVTERRAFCPMEWRTGGAGGTAGQIFGYAAVFNQPADLGWFVEEFAPGAFARTIIGDDIRALVDHDPSRIIGRNKAGTLKLSEDRLGLLMDIDVADTSHGRDIVAAVKRGDVTGASISFSVPIRGDVWSVQGGRDHRLVFEAKLYDVAPVTFPAYTQTSVSAVSAQGRGIQLSAPARSARHRIRELQLLTLDR